MAARLEPVPEPILGPGSESILESAPVPISVPDPKRVAGNTPLPAIASP